VARAEAPGRDLKVRVIALGAAALAIGAGPPAAPPRHPPALVVVIAVDQLRPDYLLRYGSQLTGGFRRLLDHAALFTQGRQDHAITETAPGHATLLSDREPAGTGIMSNTGGVTDARAPLLDSPGAPGASPVRFRGTELYDWMRAANPETRVLSVSRKDRAAILMVGRARAPVFWWSAGRFTTSRYYADTLPAWVAAFNARRSAERFAGRAWTPLLAPSAYAEPDAAPWENGGRETAFPHRFPTDSAGAAAAFAEFPWMDSLTLAFALEGVRREGLGRRDRPDLLTVSLSTTDAVGHAFGPGSRELHDQVLLVDRWLGWFLDSLAAAVPRGPLLVVLSADHGVQAMPERSGHRRVWLGDLAASTRASLRAPIAVAFESGLITADTLAIRRRGLRVDSVAAARARAVSSRRGVRRVFTPATLGAAPAADSEAALWRHAIPPDVGWLVSAVIEPGYVWSPPDRVEAEHGSTAPADVTVPIAFMGPGIPPGIHGRPVSTVDIAPTLAALLGIRPLERVDGQVLREVVPQAAPQE